MTGQTSYHIVHTQQLQAFPTELTNHHQNKVHTFNYFQTNPTQNHLACQMAKPKGQITQLGNYQIAQSSKTIKLDALMAASNLYPQHKFNFLNFFYIMQVGVCGWYFARLLLQNASLQINFSSCHRYSDTTQMITLLIEPHVTVTIETINTKHITTRAGRTIILLTKTNFMLQTNGKYNAIKIIHWSNYVQTKQCRKNINLAITAWCQLPCTTGIQPS